MKKVTKILSLVLVLALALTLAGCETAQQKAEKLAGRWVATMPNTTTEAQGLLESYDFYPEEIALVDLGTLTYVRYVEFDMELGYRFGFDIPGTKACVRSFLEGAFHSMYQGREALNDLYGMDFAPMSEEEFNAFYAELYSQATLEALLDGIAEEAYDYASLEVTEIGTFTFDGKLLMCTIDGETVAEGMGYKLTDGQLELEFVDGTEVYTRAQ